MGIFTLYSLILAFSLSRNCAVSLNVSSMMARLPPVNFGLTFSMMSLPSCLPLSSALKSRNACFLVGGASSASFLLPRDLKKGDSSL
jgi:hypothetical protein